MTDTSAAGPAGFAERVDQIHVPEPNADRERLMLILGGVLVAVGLVAVLVGYWGASGTSSPAEQIPYALSGGAFGLGLIVLGCALITRFSLARLFRFWLARIVAEHQVQTDRTVDVLERIEAALAAGGAAGGAAAGGGASASSHAAPAVDVTAPSADGAAADGQRVRREPLRAQPLEK
jgi:hypothetical protein